MSFFSNFQEKLKNNSFANIISVCKGEKQLKSLITKGLIKHSKKQLPFLLLPIVGGLINSSPSLAQSVIPAGDNTATIVTQDGDRFTINGGTLSGENLFHSFQEFGLSTNEIATFLSDSTVQNILGRVVGGNPSIIDGLLQVTGGDSNLLLMNSSGIVFGENARLDLPGSLTATTATGIEFEEGRFNATGDNNYANLQGDPTAFSFELEQPSSIINAGTLEVTDGQNISLVGGEAVNTGTLKAPGGNISIVAVPGTSRVRISQPGWVVSLEIDPSLLLEEESQTIASWDLAKLLTEGAPGVETGLQINGDGAVELSQSGVEIPNGGDTVIASGALDVANTAIAGTGGEVAILGERVGLVGADIDASGDGDGGRVLVGGDYKGEGTVPNAEITYVSQDSVIRADAGTNGDGGEVIVWADDTTAFNGEISVRGGNVTGDGGFVEVSGKETLLYRGDVSTSATNGTTGTLLLDPENITIVSGQGPDDSQIGDPGDDDGTILFDDGGSGNSFTISQGALEESSITNNIDLQASNNITIESLINDELTFSGTANISFKADADNSGVGNFTMQASDEIITGGQEITIDGEKITLGSITTGDGVIRLTANEIDFEGGLNSVNSTQAIVLETRSGDRNIVIGGNPLVDTDALDLDADDIAALGNTGLDFGTRSVSLADVSQSVSIKDGAEIVGPNTTNEWQLTSTQQGTIGSIGSVSFENIETIIGGTGNDTFIFNNDANIIIRGETLQNRSGNNSTDTADYSLSTRSLPVELTNLQGIEVVRGSTNNGVDNTLTAFNGANIWNINGNNSGQVSNGTDSIIFENFQNLTGNAENDNFNISNGGSINSINGENGDDIFNINDSSNVSTINGGNDNDTFNIHSGGGVDSINGNDGDDEFNISGGSVRNNIDGGAGQDIFNVINNGNVNSINGNDGDDEFNINGGIISNNIDGGAGQDIFNVTNSVNVNSLNGGEEKDTFNFNINSGGSVNSINGNDGDDEFNINGGTISGNIDGNNGNDIFNIKNNSIINSNISGNNGDDEFNISGGTVNNSINGDAGNDEFNINGGTINIINGGLITEDNSLSVNNEASNIWNITGEYSGSLNEADSSSSVQSFLNIQTLNGGNANDTFNFNLKDTDSLKSNINGQNGTLDIRGDRISTEGSITNSGGTTLIANNNIEIKDIEDLSGSVSLDAENNIQTNNITASGNLKITSDNNIETNEISASGNLEITGDRILTRGRITNFGSTSLEAKNDIEVVSIDVQGEGGKIDITAGGLFKATGTLVDNADLSLSTRGAIGDGSITIRHNGGRARQFFIVGNAAINGTAGEITSSLGNTITIPPIRFFPGSYEQGNIKIITPSSQNDLISPTAQPLPDATESETLAELILQELEDSITEEFANYYGRVKEDPKSLSQIQSELNLVQTQTDSQVKPAAIYPFFIKSDVDTDELARVVNSTGQQSNQTDGEAPKWQFSSDQKRSLFSSIIPYISQAEENSDKLVVMAVTAQGQPILKSTELNFGDVKAIVDELHSLLSQTPQDNGWKEYAQAMYNNLIEPIEPTLQAQGVDTLLFIMDTNLRLLPLATLLYKDENQKDKFLIEKYSVSLVPSMSLLDTQYRDIQNEPFLVMGTGDFKKSEFFPKLDDLDGVETEMQFIDSSWQGKVEVARNEEFNINRLQEALKSENSFRLLHLATHAEFKSGEPEKSYIHFSGDQFLPLDRKTIEESLGSLTQIDLLTLSACYTALGDREAELGFAGMAYQTGVQSTLASLINVKDTSTVVLMAQFYQNFNDTLTKAEALRKAQLAMLRGQVKIRDGNITSPTLEKGFPLAEELKSAKNQDFIDPSHWAWFTIVGSPW